jgi:hypothetical protein
MRTIPPNRPTLFELVGRQERDRSLCQPDKDGAAPRLAQQLVAGQQVEVVAEGDLWV